MSNSALVVNPATSSTTANQMPATPLQEQRGAVYAKRLLSHITKCGGRFFRDEEGLLFVYLKGRIISLSLSEDNIDLCDLMLEACNISTVLSDARIAIQRIRVEANRKSSQIHLRHFSACSADGSAVYIPVSGEKLLKISAASVEIAPNVVNEASFWVKHPKTAPFKYVEADPQPGLAEFEHLLVDTLACRDPEMRWLVAMNEGLFPFVRDLCGARLIFIHQGSTQQGKTTGARRFILLHGLGDVTGDGSVAGLSNQSDVGLLVLDNKEQKNLNQALIDFCLFLSTGAERVRSSNDGITIRSTNKFRPVGVITSIEGVHKVELEARAVAIPFCVAGSKFGPEETERKIGERRNDINSALIPVLQRFFSVRSERRPTPTPRPGFDGHFTALCDLLRAFGSVAGKPAGWAEKIIAAWDRIIPQAEAEEEESEFEYHIREVLLDASSQYVQKKPTKVRGREGMLYVVERCAFLLSELQKRPGLLAMLPKNPKGFSNRLLSEKFRGFAVVRDTDAPEHKELKRRANCRPFGFFIPNDDMTVNDDAKVAIVIGANQ